MSIRRLQVRKTARGACESGVRGRFIDGSRGDGLIPHAAAGGSQRGLIPHAVVGGSRRGIVRFAAEMSSQRGFSLIEIILVVVLIGGIVAFAATRILGGGDRAKYNLAKAQVQTLAEKVDQFEMDTGALPASLDQLVTQPGGAVGWLGPYAKDSELKDPWSTPYEYRAPGEGRPFDIVSYGADRKPGGDSVNADIRNE